MGEFSWMYADTHNKKALKSGGTGHLVCPDGTVFSESDYGYGIFDGQDVYDLVVDWNLCDLHPETAKPPAKMGETPEYWDWWEEEVIAALRDSGNDTAQKIIDKFVAEDLVPPYLSHDWKRHIGIAISCGDYKNSRLRYPIKIMQNADSRYEDWPASNTDPNQGL